MEHRIEFARRHRHVAEQFVPDYRNMLAQILEAGFDPGGERRIAGQRNSDAQSGAEHGRLEDAPIMFDHAVEPDLDRVLRELGDIEAEIALDGDGFHDRKSDENTSAL